MHKSINKIMFLFVCFQFFFLVLFYFIYTQGNGKINQGTGVAVIGTGQVKIGTGVAVIGTGQVKIGTGVAVIGTGQVKIGTGVAVIGTGQVKIGTGNTEESKYIDIKTHYKDLDFNILTYDKNGLTQDLFKECMVFVKEKPHLNNFFNTQLKDFNVDFSKKLMCDNVDLRDINCVKLSNYKKGDRIDLNDVVTMLYGIHTGNFTYAKYLNIISSDKINFPNLLPDLAYAKYYGLIITKQIKIEEDCINVIYKKGGIQ